VARKRRSSTTEDALPTAVAEAVEEPSHDVSNAGPESAAEGAEHRAESRRHLAVKTVAQFREDATNGWKEVTLVNTVSKNGAGLLLSRPIPVGRLVTLVMEMPIDLRAYDHYLPVYAVAGVVQNCTESTESEGTAYHVGVAFIGKKLPESFKKDPTQCYRLRGMSNSGLWNVAEAGISYHPRRHARVWSEVDVSVSLRDDERRTTLRESFRSRDVSRGGMALWGALNVKVGDRVKVASKPHEFFSMATVRNRTDHPSDEERSIVHLQFEGAEFPVERLVHNEPKGVDQSETERSETDPPQEHGDVIVDS
jgi:hypothetical protein